MATTTETAERYPLKESERTLINSLIAKQNEETDPKRKTDVGFCKNYLEEMDPAKWAQIRYAVDPRPNAPLCYFSKVKEGTRTELFEQLERCHGEIDVIRSRESKVRDLTIYQTSKLIALKKSVEACRDKAGPERLTVFIAPPGGGKSMGCNFLSQKPINARIVTANSNWKNPKNMWVPLSETARGIGMTVGKMRNPAFVVEEINELQRDFLAFCKNRKICICFDEGEHFGREALNFGKWLLNESTLPLGFFITPKQYDRLFLYYENEAQQFFRRAHATIEVSVLDKKSFADVGMYFASGQFEDRQTALTRICTAASEFGHYSLIQRVAGILKGVDGVCEDGVMEAIDQAKQQFIRQRPERVAAK